MKRMAFFCATILLIISINGFGQGQGSASVSGSVTDPSGAIIPNAKVTVVQTNTASRRSVVTNSAGEFSVPSLLPATYTVSVDAPGFKKFVETITLLADQSRALQIQMQIGQTTQQVMVEATSVALNTVSPVLGQVIETSRVMDLPMNGRNLADLTLSVPGTINANGHGVQQGTTKQIPGGAESISVNGARPDQIAYNLDGASNEDPMGNTNNPFPFPDATQEFSVQTNSFSAQYGANAGAVVNVVTKSGTNQWHGDGFEFVRNKSFNARQFGASTVDALHQNQFGGTVGGPIRRDHSFIFFGYQGTRRRDVPSLNRTTLPTPAEQTGDFSALCTAGFSATTNLCTNSAQQIKDGFTGLPLANNKIVNLDPVALNILKDLPTAAENPATGFVQYAGARDFENTNEFVTRFDQAIRGQDKLTLRLDLVRYFNLPQYNSGNLLTINTGSNIQTQNWLASYTWVPTPTLVNTAYFGVDRTASDRTQGGNVPQLSDLGSNVPELPKAQGGIRGFGVSGFFGFGGFTDGKFVRNIVTWRDNANWIRGKHTIQFGGDYERDRGIARNTDFLNPSINFNNSFTGNALASFMEGFVSSVQQSSGNYSDQAESPKGLYVGDTWHIRPRLTLDGSLRWEPFSPEKEIYGRFQQFIPAAYYAGFHSPRIPTAPAGLLFSHDCYNSYCVPSTGQKGDYKNFAPRVGFAYDVSGNGKTVVRGGGGVFYSTRLSTFFLNDPSIAPPFSLSINLSGSTASPISLSQPDASQPVFTAGYPQHYTLANVPSNVQFPSLVRAWTLSPFANWRTPAIYDWNFTVEHQMSAGALLRVSYVGTRGTRLRQDNEWNTPQASLWVSNGCPANSKQAACGTDARRPFAVLGANGTVSGLSNIYLSTNDGNSIYHALQVTLEKRPTASSSGIMRNLTLLASYTYSKAMDNGLANGGGITDIGSAGDGGTSGLPYGNPFTSQWNTGPSDSDHTHVIVASYVWQLPRFESSSNSLLKNALGGWNWGGIYSFRSGNPLTITAGSNTSQTGLGGERAVFVGSPSQYGGSGGAATSCLNSKGAVVANPCVPYLNNSVFATPPTYVATGTQTPTMATFGNLGKDSFRGPSRWNYDMDLIKDFHPLSSHENISMELRGDFFNFFKHTELNDPSTGMTSSNFGRITGAGSPRVIQLALKVFF
ncbi:MAG TPA: carboxypeptidase regulatory-like domain-containing protein [Terriglobia bacterium]|nr:carboxypeptidase regulatory-like domain-containing protein [Terriglobia bacterium]